MDPISYALDRGVRVSLAKLKETRELNVWHLNPNALARIPEVCSKAVEVLIIHMPYGDFQRGLEKKFPKLKMLRIVRAFGMNELANIPQVEWLSLVGCTPVKLSGWTQLTQLEVEDLPESMSESQLDTLLSDANHMERLMFLSLRDSGVSSMFFPKLADFAKKKESLLTLDITGALYDPNLGATLLDDFLDEMQGTLFHVKSDRQDQ